MALLLNKKTNIAKITRITKTHYSGTSILIHKFNKLNLVYFEERDKRSRIPLLTMKGREIALRLKEIDNILES